jgi:tetratricopeptide (TPR) repeat protein
MRGINKKAVLIIMAVSIFYASLSFADENAQRIFNEGNKFFVEKEYEKARNNYEKLIHMDYKDPSVYFNLSNTYMSLGMPGRAVLNLRKAKMLQPRNKDIFKNLNAINAAVAQGDLWYKNKKKTPFTLKKFVRSFDFLSKSEISIAILVFYLLFFIWYVIRRFVNTGKIKIAAESIGLASYLLTLFMIFIFIGTVYIECYYPKMVVMEKVELMSSPTEELSQITGFQLQEGMVVELGKTYGGWGNVALETSDKTGWVKLDALEKI